MKMRKHTKHLCAALFKMSHLIGHKFTFPAEILSATARECFRITKWSLKK